METPSRGGDAPRRKHGTPLKAPERERARRRLALLRIRSGRPFRRASTFVDRILRGAKPGNLRCSFRRHTRWVVNLKPRRSVLPYLDRSARQARGRRHPKPPLVAAALKAKN